jgi:hypothetical protein
MLTPKPAHTDDTFPSAYQVAFEEQRRHFLACMDESDITGQIDGDDGDMLVALVRAGDPNAVGRKLIAMMGAWADNLAHRTVEVDQQVAA